MITRRRWSNSPAIFATSSCGPPSASTAAHWAIEVGLDVHCPWRSLIALMISRGPAAKPRRQPVMA